MKAIEKKNQMKTILFLSANPKDTERKRFDEEYREIDEGLHRSKYRDQFTIKSHWAVGVRELRRGILDNEPQIVHFCGIGEKDGLKFEDKEGKTIQIQSEALSDFFKLCQDKVECVFLNACYSEIEAKAIAKHIDYVVGMKQKICDNAAIEFAVGFYDALGAGKTYKDAFKLGCNAIHMFNLPEHDVPTLEEKIINKKNYSKGNIHPDDSPIQVAIRSYMSYSEDIDDKVDQMCCLCHLFEGRHLVQGTWEDLKQQIKKFLTQKIKAGKRYDFYLPLHSSLAFFLGRELPAKSGVEVNIYQPSPRLELWRLYQRSNFKNDSIWNVEETSILNSDGEMAFACSVSHNIFPDVEAYIRNQLPHVSHLFHLTLNEMHHGSIKDANHAYEAAYKAVVHITEKYKKKGSSRLHFFIAAPNVFTFMLGQQSLQLSNITLYEFEFGANKLGAYTPSITI